MPEQLIEPEFEIGIKQTEQPTDKAFELQAQEDTFNSAPAMI
jgi:hypothetical protein